jgi:hypothetical protein
VALPNVDSWTVTSALASQTLHATLFVRDAFHLKPDDEPIIPPRLNGDVPDLSRLVSSLDVREAAIAWTPWFDRALDFECQLLLEPALTPPSIDAARAGFFDPPEFLSMWAWPALQSVARAAHREALRWGKVHSSLSKDALRHAHRDSVVASVAWETCASLHVSPARLRASVLVLDVEGVWSAYPEPGLLLCSTNVIRKESLLKEALREAFIQNLRPVEEPLSR